MKMTLVRMLLIFSAILVIVLAFRVASTTAQSTVGQRVFAESLQRQTDFCLNPAAHANAKFEEKTEMTHGQFPSASFDIYVYRSGDIVSKYIKRDAVWEGTDMRALWRGVTEHMKRVNRQDPKQWTFLDIGAQVGFYGLGFAKSGFRVIAFEPMPSNVYMVRKSICKNTGMNILLVDSALGEKEDTCYLRTPGDNLGDPSLFCGQDVPAGWEASDTTAVHVNKLDDFADMLENVIGIKMDIEGFEHNVMKGGRRVLLDMHVPIIMTEFSQTMQRQKHGDPLVYLQEFERAGYRFSMADFGRALLSIDQIMQMTTRGEIINLYLMHNSAM